MIKIKCIFFVAAMSDTMCCKQIESTSKTDVKAYWHDKSFWFSFPLWMEIMSILIRPSIQLSQRISFLKYFPNLQADILSKLSINNGHLEFSHLFISQVYSKCLHSFKVTFSISEEKSVFFLAKCSCSYSTVFFLFGSYTFN